MNNRDEGRADWGARLLERLDAAVDSRDVGLWEWDSHAAWLIWDARMYDLFDAWTRADQAKTDFVRRVRTLDRPRAPDGSTDADGLLLQGDFRIDTTTGERWVRIVADRILDGSGRPARLVGASWEIVAARDVAHPRRQGIELLELTLASISDAVVITDDSARITFLNAAAEALTGREARRAFGLPAAQVLDLRSQDGDDPMANLVEDCVRSGASATRLQAQLWGAEGAIHEVEISAGCMRSRQGEVIGAVVLVRDVTEARRVERELRWAATHDALTGLANRKELEEALADAAADCLENGGRHVLGYLDIDQFKIINDSAGHGAGDLFLRQISQVFERMIKPHDILARMGGDEFALIFVDEDMESATVLSEQLVQAAQNFRFVWQDRVYRTGISIGLCPIEPNRPSAELLSRADSACYAAKTGGRGRVAAYRPSSERSA